MSECVHHYREAAEESGRFQCAKCGEHRTFPVSYERIIDEKHEERKRQRSGRMPPLRVTQGR